MKGIYISVIGHGRHGKDALCEILRDNHGFQFQSSSWFCAERAVYPLLCDHYSSVEEAYADRHNHRALWFDIIRSYNALDPKRTATGMQDLGMNIYNGMRSRTEHEACVDAGVFHAYVWVHRPGYPTEPADSMELTSADADYIINNDGDLSDLAAKAERLVASLRQSYGAGF